jgi:Arc/MetJ-type ribon-helix-helix transcriptional regulator
MTGNNVERENTIALETKIPIQLRQSMRHLVTEGWYKDENDLVLAALRRFLALHQTEVMAEQIREDITWGLHGQE